MALIAVTGDPGCRYEEAGRITAIRLGYELVTELRLAGLIEEQFGPNLNYPPRVHADLAASVLAGLLWEVVGPTATFGAGAAFSLVALAGLALVRTKTPAG